MQPKARPALPFREVLLGIVLACGFLPACKREPSPDPPEATAVDGAASTEGSGVPSSSAPESAPSASPPPPRPPLELLRFAFAESIRGKEPTSKLTFATPGEKVYGHLAIRNRSRETRHVRVVFKIGEETRTLLDLAVDPSWSFRTWGYATLRASDRGKVHLRATDDEGNVLVEEDLPIRAPKEKKR
jgi:hypothetical protein